MTHSTRSCVVPVVHSQSRPLEWEILGKMDYKSKIIHEDIKYEYIYIYIKYLHILFIKYREEIKTV